MLWKVLKLGGTSFIGHKDSLNDWLDGRKENTDFSKIKSTDQLPWQQDRAETGSKVFFYSSQTLLFNKNYFAVHLVIHISLIIFEVV